MNIEHEFRSSLNRHTADLSIQHKMWREIETQYRSSGRHYHNLQHLDALLHELLPYRESFTDWDAVVFAIAYHDIVYNTLKSNNEEKSAELAVGRLSSIGCPHELISTCDRMIRATKKHEPADRETNLFTDADLSILGALPEIYHQYTQQIRKEYSIYPDLVYNPGRKKVLRHFREMTSLFKTDEFRSRYEVQARQNIDAEIARYS